MARTGLNAVCRSWPGAEHNQVWVRAGRFLILGPLYNSTRNPTHSPLGRVRSAKVRAPASVSSLLSQPDSRLWTATRLPHHRLHAMLHDPVASISSSCPARPESEPRSSCEARLPTYTRRTATPHCHSRPHVALDQVDDKVQTLASSPTREAPASATASASTPARKVPASAAALGAGSECLDAC